MRNDTANLIKERYNSINQISAKQDKMNYLSLTSSSSTWGIPCYDLSYS